MKLLFAILAIALACATATAAANRRTSDVGFDFFVFARQWDPAYCLHHSCGDRKPSRTNFGIHGLWPEYAEPHGKELGPMNCDSSHEFDESKISDLLPELKAQWPSFAGSDDTFWQHEWEKHGTCAEPITGDEHGYFSSVLQLNSQYDMLGALTNSSYNIQPSDTTQYSASDIMAAIKEQLGATPIMDCKGGDLTEMWLCYDLNLQVIDCNEYPAVTRSHKSCRSVRLPVAHTDDSTAKE